MLQLRVFVEGRVGVQVSLHMCSGFREPKRHHLDCWSPTDFSTRAFGRQMRLGAEHNRHKHITCTISFKSNIYRCCSAKYRTIMMGIHALRLCGNTIMRHCGFVVRQQRGIVLVRLMQATRHNHRGAWIAMWPRSFVSSSFCGTEDDDHEYHN